MSKNLEKKAPQWVITRTYEITPIYLSKVCPKLQRLFYKNLSGCNIPKELLTVFVTENAESGFENCRVSAFQMQTAETQYTLLVQSSFHC